MNHWLVLVLVAAPMFAASGQDRPRDAREDSLASRYSRAFASGPFLRDTTTSVRDSLPVDSIVLRRHGCLGPCPIYTVVLYRDGRAHYVGGNDAPRRGEWSGHVPLFEYVRLVYLIEYLQFATLDSSYSRWVTDMPGVWVTVGWRGSRGRQTVYDYALYGPPRLWALEEAVDAVSSRVEWGKK